MKYANKKSGGWRAYTFEELCKVKGYEEAIKLAKTYMTYDFPEYYNSTLATDTANWLGNGWLMTIFSGKDRFRCICDEKGLILECIDNPLLNSQKMNFKEFFKACKHSEDGASFDQRKIVL